MINNISNEARYRLDTSSIQLRYSLDTRQFIEKEWPLSSGQISISRAREIYIYIVWYRVPLLSSTLWHNTTRRDSSRELVSRPHFHGHSSSSSSLSSLSSLSRNFLNKTTQPRPRSIVIPPLPISKFTPYTCCSLIIRGGSMQLNERVHRGIHTRIPLLRAYNTWFDLLRDPNYSS